MEKNFKNISNIRYFRDEYTGGVTAYTTEQFHKMNGFSNLFYGWGGEGICIYRRKKIY